MKLTHRTMFLVKEHTGLTNFTDIDANAKVTDFFSIPKLITYGCIASRIDKRQLEEPGVYQISWFMRKRTIHSRLERLS